MKQKLYLDLETYSSVDITKSGAYKYTESVDFEILILCWALNDGQIHTVDLAMDEKIPIGFLIHLADPEVEKHAHNANFERLCLKAIGIDVPINEWHCSAVKSSCCGLPRSLGDVSSALHLNELGKLATGKALVRFFSIPIKPTKSNNMRVRNHPIHDMDKWNEYKQYCANDVVAEREIDKTLSIYETTETERKAYILDQQINDRGILIDLEFAKNAICIDNKSSEVLEQRLIELTGLENPNSPAQLKQWLSSAMKKEISTLAKEQLKEMLEEVEAGDVKEVLELRQKASKTSTKKYEAMINCYGHDYRARGLFEFCAAGRTGRWAGRLIQLQNLPQNHLSDLDEVREIVRNGNFDHLDLIHDDIPSVLSQLIRTAFVAEPGNTFGVADFSAIEARIIAWLANEPWRLEVFNTHGKIYEASVAMMLGVPIESIAKGSPERQKGKIAELALGYGGSIGALEKMGGEKMGLSVQEMKTIVREWREVSPRIPKLWDQVNTAAVRATKTKKKVVLLEFRDLIFEHDGKCLMITLPSGRKLFYQSAVVTQGKFGTECIKYKGLDQVTRQWWWVDTYGGKLVENIVQAIARDVLSEAMLKLDKANFEIVMHVHDEVVAELKEETAEKYLKTMCAIMGEKIDWAPGLYCPAEGYTTNYYRKD